MSDEVFSFSEFIEKKPEPAPVAAAEVAEEPPAPELEIQKAVVEQFAAEKAVLDENIEALRKEVEDLKHALCVSEQNSASLTEQNAILEAELEKARAKSAALDAKLNERLVKELDDQVRNPNALALLDRDVDLPDRFPGETRDHVLEVVKEARDAAEAQGRIRRAQLLEGVLVANEPNGGLAKKRANLEKFFAMNGNIVNGPVIEELERCGISYKDGDTYLLPKEIMLRTY